MKRFIDFIQEVSEEVEQVDESKQTTHKDPLVTVHQKEGKGWVTIGHMNLSSANKIHELSITAPEVHSAGVGKLVKNPEGTHAVSLSKHHDSEVVKEEVEQVDERINMIKAKMGDVIKDFYKSKAPQFKGRSKTKRRQMAIAAKLSAMRKSKMSEELKGNQHKIDANKNNKIDAHDFKLLRSKLKVKNEEVEQMNEISSDTAKSFLDKVRFKQARRYVKANMGAPKEKLQAASDLDKTAKSMELARKRVKEEVESIDELKKSTMASYVSKAAGSYGRDKQLIGRESPDGTVKNARPELKRAVKNRLTGINRAAERLAK